MKEPASDSSYNLQSVGATNLELELSEQLESEPHPFVALLETEQQTLEAGQVYFSAGGKKCRAIQFIKTNQEIENHIACRVQENVWVLNKALP